VISAFYPLGLTTAVPQIAADLLQRSSRWSRATRRHCWLTRNFFSIDTS